MARQPLHVFSGVLNQNLSSAGRVASSISSGVRIDFYIENEFWVEVKIEYSMESTSSLSLSKKYPLSQAALRRTHAYREMSIWISSPSLRGP